MDLFDLREPASAWTHGVGLLLALPGTLLLWRRSRGAPLAKRLSLLVFGLSLVACYAASTLYHGVRRTEGGLGAFDRMDRIGIFLLIAGSYTPLAWGLLRGRWRWGTLTIVWLIAAVASVRLALRGPFSPLWSTVLYLGLGWGVVVCSAELGRVVPRRALRPLVVGGLCYSLGSVINLLGWPAPWPGTFGAHELFHLFVLAGSLAHYRLILRVVVPFEPGTDLRVADSSGSPGRSCSGARAVGAGAIPAVESGV